jgi:hypothetical protein
VLEVFDVKLKEAIYKLPFDKILTLKNVSDSGTTPLWLLQLLHVGCGCRPCEGRRGSVCRHCLSCRSCLSTALVVHATSPSDGSSA